MRTVVALSIFAIVFLTLVVASYTRQSATWDEPQHLLAGYQIRVAGDYRFDPEHPPFLRWWASLPVKADRNLPPLAVEPRGQSWLMFQQFVAAHEFLYYLNDADKLLYRARFMNALWGVALGCLLFAFACERFGYWPAVGALALFTLEPNILAHAGLVTTDFGITLFCFATVYFLWRYLRQPHWRDAALMVAAFALANISKFTGVLLVPIVITGLGIAVARRRLSAIRAVAVTAAMMVTTYGAIWAAYSFRYAPAPEGAPTLGVPEMETVQQRVPGLLRITGWLAERRALPNAYLEGFLLGQSKSKERPAYLAGRYSLEGWWYFFPLALLIKTPVALLTLFVCGLVAAARRWRDSWQDDALWLLAIVVFLGAAMTAKLNIGLRHILPIFPFLILFAAGALAAWWSRWRPWACLAVAAVAVELAFVYPHCLACFNFTVGGPAQGGRYLSDSNLDWGQDLKGLKRWMDARQVKHINLSYFGTASSDYYKISCTHLPGSLPFAQAQLPLLPGYVAISETNLRGVYLTDEGRAFYRPFIPREPVANIGYSIKIYWADRPWW